MAGIFDDTESSITNARRGLNRHRHSPRIYSRVAFSCLAGAPRSLRPGLREFAREMYLGSMPVSMATGARNHRLSEMLEMPAATETTSLFFQGESADGLGQASVIVCRTD